MSVNKYKRSTAMIQQQKSAMNFLLVLGFVTTAAFAAPVQEEGLLQVAVSHDHTNGDSRDGSLTESSIHDSSEANPESTVKVHTSTSSELSLGNGNSLNESKSTDNKKSRALVEGEKGSSEVTKSLGKGLSNSHMSVTGNGGYEHSTTSSVRGNEDGGSKESINNAEGSGSHSDVNINTQHEDIRGIKESTDVNPQGSGDSESGGGDNQRQSIENGFETTGKLIASHTESGKSSDLLEHGGNDESSLGGSTGNLNSGTAVTSHIVKNEQQSKDSSAVSDNPVNEHKQPKALILDDGSGSRLTGTSESETVRPEDSHKLYNDGTGSVNYSGSSGTSENENDHILHADATLGASISSGGTNSGSSNSVDQNGNEHRSPKGLTTLGANTSSGDTSTGSSDFLDQSANGHTKQEIRSNSSGKKGETEKNPVSDISNSNKSKELGAGFEHGLSSENILEGGVELNHGVISAEANGKGMPGNSATQSSTVQSELQSGDHLLPNAVSVGGDHKAEREGTQESSFSEKNYNKDDSGHSSESVQNHHELTAHSNGKFSLQNGKLLSVHVLRENTGIPDSEAGSNRNQHDRSLGVTKFSGTENESIHGKPSEHGFISSTDESVSKSTGGCDDSIGKVDSQNQQRKHQGFAWIDDNDDDKFEGASGGENGNKDAGVSVDTSVISGTTGSGGLGVKLEGNVGDGNESKNIEKENHEHVTEIKEVKPGILTTEGNAENNKAEKTEPKSEYNENKNTEESDNVSHLSKGVGREHEDARSLNTELEVSLGGGETETSSVSGEKHGSSLKNVQGETGFNPGVTISGVAGTESHKTPVL